MPFGISRPCLNATKSKASLHSVSYLFVLLCSSICQLNAAPFKPTARIYLAANTPSTTSTSDYSPATDQELNNELAIKQGQYDDLIIKAFDAYSEGRFSDALTAADEAIQIAQKAMVADKGSRAYFISGLAFYKSNKNNDSINHLKSALRRSSGDQELTIRGALKIVLEKNSGKTGGNLSPTSAPNAVWTAVTASSQHINPASAVSFSPDGRILASGSWKSIVTKNNVGKDVPGQISEIILWDTKSGRALRKMDGQWKPKWDGKGPKPPWAGHFGKVNILTFAPNGRVLASGGEDGRLTLWSTINGTPNRILDKLDTSVIGISWLNPNLMTVISRDGLVLIVNPNTGEKIKALQLGNSKNNYRTCTISNDGTRVATGDAAGGIAIWDLPSGTLLRRIQNSQYQDINRPGGVEVTAMAFSSDAKLLVSANHAHVYLNVVGKTDSVTSNIYQPKKRVGQLCFSPDDLTIYVICEDRVDAITSPDPSNPILMTQASTLTGYSSLIRALDISHQGSQISGGAANGTVVLWK